MKRRISGQKTKVFRSGDIQKMFTLQSDICKCENQKCFFNNETKSSFSKKRMNLIKKECLAHGLSKRFEILFNNFIS